MIFSKNDGYVISIIEFTERYLSIWQIPNLTKLKLELRSVLVIAIEQLQRQRFTSLISFYATSTTECRVICR